MNEMDTLTVNGTPYEVTDRKARQAAASVLEDGTVSDKTGWSSQKILNAVAKKFTISGPTVTCCPIAGYLKQIISETHSGTSQCRLVHGGRNLFAPNMTPLKTGQFIDKNGKFKPDAPFSVYKIPCKSSQGYTFYIGKTMYSPAICFYDSDDRWIVGHTINQHNEIQVQSPPGAAYMLCSVNTSSASANYNKELFQVVEGKASVPVNTTVSTEYTAQVPPDAVALDWLNWRYRTSDGQSKPMAGIAPAIASLDGVNTLYTDAGDTTVSGYQDPNAAIAEQQEQIDHLKNAILTMGGNL